MKGLSKMRYVVVFLLLGILCVSSCKKKSTEDPVPNDEAAIRLNGDWYLPESGGGMVIDGVDRSLNYPNFKMSFATNATGGDKTYRTENAGKLFRSSGQWDWASTSKTTMAFDDGKNMNIQSQQASRMVLTFNHTSGGVRAGVSGNYTMTLEKR